MAFRINTPTVVHEVIEGEAVIVNMQSGHYYSTSAVGVEIWKLIDAGHTLAQIEARVRSAYTGQDEDVAGTVAAFVKELEDEELIVSVEDNGEEPVLAEPGNRASRDEFSRPRLEKYTDMEQLLLLDPIHEVTDAGWPEEKKA